MIRTSPPSGSQIDYSRTEQRGREGTGMIHNKYITGNKKQEYIKVLHIRQKNKDNRLRQVTPNEYNLICVLCGKNCVGTEVDDKATASYSHNIHFLKRVRLE